MATKINLNIPQIGGLKSKLAPISTLQQPKQMGPAPLKPGVTMEEVKQTAQMPKPIQKEEGLGIIPTAGAMEPPTDEELQTLIDEGYTDDEIMSLYEEETPQPAQESKPVQQESALGMIGRNIQGAGRFVQDVAGGAVAETPAMIGNVVGGAGKVIGAGLEQITPGFGKGATELGQKFQDIGQSGKEFVQKYGAYEPESTGAAIGEVGADIGGSIALPGGVLKKGVGLGQGIIRGIGQGIIEMGKFSAVSKGELPTKEEVVIGGALGAAGPVISKGADYAKTKLMLSNLINPAKLGQIKDKIIQEGVKEGDEVVKGLEKMQKKPELVSDFLFNKGIKGSKEEMTQQLLKNASKSKELVDTQLATIGGKFKKESTNKALQVLEQSYAGDVGNEAIYNKIVDYSKKVTKSGKGLSVSEMNNVKRLLDRGEIGIFSTTGKIKTAKTGLANIRGELKTDIENIATSAGFKDIKMLNNETAVSNSLADAIMIKEDADFARQLLSPFGTATIGGTAGAFSGNTPEEKIKNFLIGVVGGGLLGSTKLKSNLATIINNLTPSEKGVINSFIESRGQTTLPTNVFNKLKNITKDLKFGTPGVGGIKVNKGGYIDIGQIGKDLGIKPLLGKVDDLVSEAKKYKSAEEFVNKNLEVDTLLPSNRPMGEKTLADLKYTGSKANTQKVKVSPIEDVINRAKQVVDSGGDGSVGNYEVYDVLKKVKNGRIKVYHGTSEAGANTIGSGWAGLNDGSYLSLTKGAEKEAMGVYGAKYYADIASKYGKGGQVLEFEIPLKNVAIDKTTGELRYVSDKTKSQLTDIWNEANKATPEQSLIQEAKKYKSAEEFVKAQGTPVYHGSPSKIIGELKSSKELGTSQHTSKFGGVFFSENKAVADAYSKLPNRANLSQIKRPEVSNYVDRLQKKITEYNNTLDELYQQFDKQGWIVDNNFERYVSAERGGKPIKDKIAKIQNEIRDIKKTAPDLTDTEKSLLYGNANIQEVVLIGDVIYINKRVGFSENREALIEKYKGKIIKLKDGNNQVEYIATDPSQIKTKSQLTDIWNKANQSKGIKPTK